MMSAGPRHSGLPALQRVIGVTRLTQGRRAHDKVRKTSPGDLWSQVDCTAGDGELLVLLIRNQTTDGALAPEIATVKTSANAALGSRALRQQVRRDLVE